MNTLGYLQFFDGLAEKKQGSFSMERVSTKICNQDLVGEKFAHRCKFSVEENLISGLGNSRKEALKSLYRKLKNFK